MPECKFIIRHFDAEYTIVCCSNCGSQRRIKSADIDQSTGTIKGGLGLRCGFCNCMGYVVLEDSAGQHHANIEVITTRHNEYPPIVFTPSYEQSLPLLPDPINVARCPKCGSTSITIKQKGFGIVKAGIGAIVAGPVGLLAGGIGSGKTKNYCMNCGNEWRP